jgi:transposase
MKKQYIVTLTPEERIKLRNIATKGENKVRTIIRAKILLKADQSNLGPSWTDAQISSALDVGTATIERLRKQFVEEGLEASLKPRRKTFTRHQRKLDGHKEAQLITLACSEPPDGCSRWSLRLLADTLVELEIVDSISHETVRQTLKKRC